MIGPRAVVRGLALIALAAGTAGAAPPGKPTRTPPPADDQPADKLDAKSLMQSGLKLFAAKDFLGALAVFQTAYARFPSAKILLNIGTTLARLDRKAEAANVYQRYLDAPDSDPARQAEVKKVLAQLDAAVATLELAITPGDAEVQINDEDWLAAAGEPRHRVAPGPVRVRARRAAYQPAEQVVTAAAGARLPVTIALAEIPAPPAPPAEPAPVTDHTLATTVRTARTTRTARIEPPRARFGVLAMAHIDLANGGGAGLVGVTADVTDRLALQAAAILGPSYGGYAGASFAITGGRIRPLVAAGVPIFGSHGARVGLRGAAGVEIALHRRLAVIAELGVEYLLNPEAGIDRTLLVPAIGATGRL